MVTNVIIGKQTWAIRGVFLELVKREYDRQKLTPFLRNIIILFTRKQEEYCVKSIFIPDLQNAYNYPRAFFFLHEISFQKCLNLFHKKIAAASISGICPGLRMTLGILH